MVWLVASICLSVLLLVNFRLFGRFNVNTTLAVSLNYVVCFVTGFLLLPKGQKFELQFSENWTWYCLLLGIGFVITFLLSGFSTKHAGITPTALANNLSLVIPVCISLFFLSGMGKVFDLMNYAGIGIAILAMWFSAFRGSGEAFQKQKWWLPLGVFLMYGITNSSINLLNAYYIPHPENTISVMLVMVFGAMLAGLVLAGVQIMGQKKELGRPTILAAFSLGVPNFLSFYFLIRALSYFGNSGAFVFPVYNMGLILLSALVGMVFFKEKLQGSQGVGLLLGLLAIILLSHQEIGF